MTVPADIQFRRHTRFAGFDYGSSYAYFVTMCVRDRECVFGSIVDETVSLSRRGAVARDCWLDIPNHHSHVELDTFVIMPNHVHGVLLFVGDTSVVGATPASRPSLATGPRTGSLGAVIGSYKASVTTTINRLRRDAGTNLWQSNYYDHIIRNDRARDRIRNYIDSNPARWQRDSENPLGDGTDALDAFIASLNDSPLRSDRDAGVAPTGGRS